MIHGPSNVKFMKKCVRTLESHSVTLEANTRVGILILATLL